MRAFSIKIPLTAVSLAVSLFIGLRPAFGANDGNLLLNSSFEQIQDGKAAVWGTSQWHPDASGGTFRSASGAAHSGQSAVRIVNAQANDSRYWQEVQVQENQAYRLSGWIKTVDVGDGRRGANLSIEGRVETSPDIRGTTADWQYVELYVYVNPGVKSLKATAGIGTYGDLNTGSASFDDIRLEAVASIPAGAAVAQLGDTQAQHSQNAPIDPSAVDFGYHQGPDSSLYILIAVQAVILGSALLRLAFKRHNQTPPAR
jgi:dolichyl-phosphate-mannose-protein mannosyltransferase